MKVKSLTIKEAPTGKTTCSECGSIIPKGATRIDETHGSGQWQKTTRYCPKCGLIKVNGIIEELTLVSMGLFKELSGCSQA